MEYRYAPRMEQTPRSFIREILKVTERPEVISFAGGLPNPDCFDTAGIRDAAVAVLDGAGSAALQYATTEGFPPLRQWIADRYRRRLGLEVSPDEILITNGSQQCLDLIGKVLLGGGDSCAIERPGYLGAIQAFSLYEPVFVPVPLDAAGPEPSALAAAARAGARLFYGVPNSQNPSGTTWSAERRTEVAEALEETGTLLVEDDAYGELRFDGPALSPLRALAPERTLMTGSFSKVLAPGLRLGWVVAPPEVMHHLVTAKQASDLHSNTFAQRVAAQYLASTPIDDHVARITSVYRSHRDLMLALATDLFPEGVSWTRPDGGMFVWLTLPEGCSSMALFEAALKSNVAILPGLPFYTDGGGDRTVRLNFSNADEASLKEGMGRLARALAEQLRAAS
ncbi:MAG: PLP-dependent aminotransferase family protein [Methanospirillum sp.]